MASDSEDFESYNPTTPVAPKVNGKTTKSAAARKPKANKRKRKSPSPGNSDIEEVEPREEPPQPEDIQMVEDSPPPLKRKATTKSSSKDTRSSNKAKGKAKATEEEVDAQEEEEGAKEESERPKAPGKKSAKAKPIKPAEPAVTLPSNNADDKKRIRELERSNAQLQQTNERLTKELDAARHSCEQLEKQFEELSRIRETESEGLLQELKQQHEASVQAQDLLVNELKAQLSVFEPYSHLMNSRTLDYVKREDADKEKRELEQHYAAMKKDLVAKQELIEELEKSKKTLQRDLDNEIKHSKALAARPGNTQVQVAGMDIKKHEALVRFYEDLTNLLVTNVKIWDSQYFKRKDTLFTCIYSAEQNDEDEPAALNFTLKFYSEVAEDHEGPVTHESHLVDAIGYTPMELDKESTEFKEKLKFLGNSFTFQKAQFPLFLRELHKALNEEIQEEPSAVGTD